LAELHEEMNGSLLNLLEFLTEFAATGLNGIKYDKIKIVEFIHY
jgi:hypothetical protein